MPRRHRSRYTIRYTDQRHPATQRLARASLSPSCSAQPSQGILTRRTDWPCCPSSLGWQVARKVRHAIPRLSNPTCASRSSNVPHEHKGLERMALVGGDLGFGASLFIAADKLRGCMEPSDYKHVTLGLIFLRQIPGSFEAKAESSACRVPRHGHRRWCLLDTIACTALVAQNDTLVHGWRGGWSSGARRWINHCLPSRQTATRSRPPSATKTTPE